MYSMIGLLRAAVAGFGGAFGWSGTGRIQPFIRRQSVDSRIHENFARVGARMEAAMERVKDEKQKEAAAK